MFCSSFFLLEPEPKKAKKGGAKAEKVADGPIMYQDPPDKLASPSGKKYTLKITSWNVDGIRAWVKKKGVEVTHNSLAGSSHPSQDSVFHSDQADSGGMLVLCGCSIEPSCLIDRSPYGNMADPLSNIICASGHHNHSFHK